MRARFVPHGALSVAPVPLRAPTVPARSGAARQRRFWPVAGTRHATTRNVSAACPDGNYNTVPSSIASRPCGGAAERIEAPGLIGSRSLELKFWIAFGLAQKLARISKIFRRGNQLRFSPGGLFGTAAETYPSMPRLPARGLTFRVAPLHNCEPLPRRCRSPAGVTGRTARTGAACPHPVRPRCSPSRP